MPVTELAQLRLLSISSIDTPELDSKLLSSLKRAQQVLTSSSGHPFQIYRCKEDPNLLYIIGAWDTVDFHRKTFLPSPENQELLELLKDTVEVKFMFHIDIDQSIHPIVARKDASSNQTLAIGRHFISGDLQAKFQESFDQNVKALRSFLDSFRGNALAGWRIDEPEYNSQDDKTAREFVLFTSWPGVEKHAEFGRSEEFKKYAQIRDYIDLGAEIKHVVPLEY